MKVMAQLESNRFYLQDRLSQSEFKQLKDLALKMIQRRDWPTFKTIELQISYDTTYCDQQISKKDRNKKISLQSGRMIDEVVSVIIKSGKDFEGLSLLYKKVFNFLLFKNKQLTGKEQLEENILNIEKEVAAALQSIIPRAALGPFVSLNPTEKVTQLIELSNLVIGIRLFNQEIAKGGTSLIPVLQLIEHPGREILKQIRKQASQIIEHCQNYTYVLSLQLADLTINITQNDISRYKDQLTFLRQYLSYIVTLQEDIQISQNTVEINQSRFRKEVHDLKNLLGTKTSAPKEQVYPKFAILAQSYVQLFQEKKESFGRIQLLTLLLQSRKQFALTLPQRLIQVAKSMNISSYSQEHQIQYDIESGVQRMLPYEVPDFMQIPLDYLGFCLWSIVKKNGLLILGKPSLGVYKYKERNCVFSKDIYINDFLKEPDVFIEGVINQCRRNPQLIHLLRLQSSFKGLNLNIMQEIFEAGLGMKNRLMVDKATQTPTHFIQKNIDPNYCWNQWQLRKKAIQMANIRKRMTKACQTILSNYRTDSDVQTWLPKQASTLTMNHYGFSAERHLIEHYSPEDKRERPRVYITGLRGNPKS